MKLTSQLQALEAREFYGLLVSAPVLVVTLAVSFVLLPQYRALGKAQIARAALPGVSVRQDELEQRLRHKDNEVSARVAQLLGDSANLPAREIEAFVIDRLQTLAWRHAVTLEGIEPSLGEEVGPFQELLFSLVISGKYPQLFDWLADLRHELGFVMIKEYEMSRQGDAAVDPDLRVRVTVASYRREQADEI